MTPRFRRAALAFFFSALAVANCLAQTKKISAVEASRHTGEQATVCDSVASTKFADKSRGAPTFINLDKPYPNQIFTIVIWGEDRPKFGRPEETFQGKRICVTGTIASYRGTPEIVVKTPEKIKIEGD